MSERKSVFLLITIMMAACLVVAGVTMSILYRTALREERARLKVTAQSQARLIEAVARFDSVYSKNYPGGAKLATLNQIIDAHDHYRGFGKTGEFTLSRKEGKNMVFLLNHRHHGIKKLDPVPYESELAEPMRRALSGQSGTVIGLDYQGDMVLAAYEPLADLDLGIVAKINVSEVRAPFVKSGLIGLCFTVLVVLIGIRFFIRITNPMVRQLEKRALKLKRMTDMMTFEIIERKQAEEDLQKAHDDLDRQVNQRTAELTETNEELKTEIEVHKQTKEMLQQNEKLLQTVVDGISDPLILLDENLRVKILNNAALRYYQKEKKGVINSCCYRAFRGKSEPCDGCRVPTAIANRQSVSFERSSPNDLDRLEQVIIYQLDEKDTQLGRVIIRIHDITEARLMERQMIHAEKLASLGLMSSCITHEITNPISAITFNAPILKDYIKAMISIIDDYAKDRQDFEVFRLPYPQFRKDAYKIMTNIVHGSERVGAIVSNLRKIYQKKDEPEKRWFNLKPVIERTVALMRAETRRYVKFFEINIPEHLPEIYAVPDTVEQILINLLTNAAHASDKKDSRIKLDVAVGNTWRDHLIIDISDNGCGMDKETLSKIFNPFFSTKEPGKGTGLGLHVCQNLIQKLDGRIEVQSEAGKGSVFRVILPEFDRRSVKRL